MALAALFVVGGHSSFSDITWQKLLQFLWPRTLCSLVQIASNLVQGHIVWSYVPYRNLEKIDHSLHDHVSGDVISKPPVGDFLLYVPHDLIISELILLSLLTIRVRSGYGDRDSWTTTIVYFDTWGGGGRGRRTRTSALPRRRFGQNVNKHLRYNISRCAHASFALTCLETTDPGWSSRVP